MVYIDESRLAGYRNTIRAHKQSLLASDQLATSLERKGGMNLEMEQVAAQVEESIFTDGCHCGYEEGRGEADRLNHKENCLADGDRAWDSFRDSATDAEMAEFEKEQDELYQDSFDMTDVDKEEL